MTSLSRFLCTLLAAALFTVSAPTQAWAAKPQQTRASAAEEVGQRVRAKWAEGEAQRTESKPAFSKQQQHGYAERERQNGPLEEYRGGSGIVIGVSAGVVIAVLAVALIIVLVRR